MTITVNEKRTPIELEEGLLYWDGLTADDVALAEHLVRQAGAVDAYTLEKEPYIGFTGEDGKAVAYLYKTRVTITPRAATMPLTFDRPTPADIEDGGVDVFLSTWEGAHGVGDNAPRPTVQAPTHETCDLCPRWTRDGICATCARGLGI